MTKPRILTLDLELAPSLAAVWGIWNVNIPITNITGESEVLSCAWKWHGSDEVEYTSLRMAGHNARGRKRMLKQIHKAVSEADIVVGYNTDKFDLKILNQEFLLAGLDPPAPYHSVDLLKVVKRRFRFTSNKLDYICKRLEIGHKLEHMGMEMWLKCMTKGSEGYQEAWDMMEQYNVHDVTLTEELYDRLLGWIPRHPSIAVIGGDVVCPRCGGQHLQNRGWATTQAGRYKRYRCTSCGGWTRSAKCEPTTIPLSRRQTQIA